ncbi:MAG TPA: adenylate/guanylate cyclase domain-containing protein [Candidatus Acidoferrum sp.]|nr:adenylate/guanylate cyclase domain-containing protein [Candidatus Acidoferrum sp.]
MKLKPFKRMPVLIAFGVILLVSLVRLLQFDLFERLERMTYDFRARLALHTHAVVSTNLGFVFIDEESVKRVWDGSLGYHFGLLWPRQVYGAVVHELAQQGAKAIALDILFGELRADQPPVQMGNGAIGEESDEFLANQMRRAGNVLIAATADVIPPNLFVTNALAAGDISADKDPDGILRRARAFRIYRHWHEAFRQMEANPEYAVDLRRARIEARQIILPRPPELGDIKIPLDADGNFAVTDFWGDTLPPGTVRKAKPFTDKRVWHMGVVLAACELNLDLADAQIDLAHGRITLRSPAGVQRVIPVDADGYFYIDWCLPEGDPQLTEQPIHDLLAQYRRRLEGQTNALVDLWRGKLALVGSRAVVGNNLTDRGATPLSNDTLLVSKHWNVANSIITGRFVRRASLETELALIALLGIIAAIVTWQLRVLVASGVVALVLVLYTGLAVALYVQTRVWLPLVLPVCGAWLTTYICLVTWRVVFEQAEQRRIKSFFSTLVSPKIVHELLQAQNLSLAGARREVTVLFADVRGFTEFTDSSQERVAEVVRRNQLTGAAAEACFDEQARETLGTINLYLGLVAGTIIRQDGTLDKFIGDCVMAFWGAPTPNPRHAVACVRAAIEAQRAIYELNRQRLAENKQLESDNRARLASGLPPREPLPILFLGTGINTGLASVGIMGAVAKAVVSQGNYTVFGREVNLASRLEGASGRGRIFISQATFEHLRRDDPALAAICVSLPPKQLKGIRTLVQIYEVPWRLPGAPLLEQEFELPATSDTTAFASGTAVEATAIKTGDPGRP